VLAVGRAIGENVRALAHELDNVIQVWESILEHHQVGLDLRIRYVSLDLLKPEVVEQLGQRLERLQSHNDLLQFSFVHDLCP